jgi:predicted PP-loop superfamily ATPase
MGMTTYDFSLFKEVWILHWAGLIQRKQTITGHCGMNMAVRSLKMAQNISIKFMASKLDLPLSLILIRFDDRIGRLNLILILIPLYKQDIRKISNSKGKAP